MRQTSTVAAPPWLPLTLVLSSAVMSAGAAFASQQIDPVYQNQHSLRPYGGKVDDGHAKFYFLSDVADSGVGLPRIVPWVRNTHEREPLIFTWVEAGIWRKSMYALPAGEIEDGSYHVCGYYEHPNTNTRILYTQQERRRRAAAYQERTAACPANEDASLQSHVRTAFIDELGEEQRIYVELESALEGDEILYRLSKNTSGVNVALGRLSAAIAALENKNQIDEVREAINEWANEYKAEVTYTTLEELRPDSEFIAMMPVALRTEQVIVFDTFGDIGDHYMEWRIETEPFEEVFQTTAPISLLDKEGELITTGTVALYLPQTRASVDVD